MWPTFQQINEDAIQPLDNGDITIEEAYKAAETPIRDFMYGQTQEKICTYLWILMEKIIRIR